MVVDNNSRYLLLPTFREWLSGAGVFLVFWISSVLFAQNLALADTSWLKQASDCLSLGRGLADFLSSLPDLDRISDSEIDVEQGELFQVLEVVCSEPFETCDFEVCRAFNYRPKEALATVEPENRNLELSASKRRSNDGPNEEQQNSLAWLNQYMSCGQLVSEIKTRYGGKGRVTELPRQSRAELKFVLELSCSDRFAHCAFKSCHSESGSTTSQSVKTKHPATDSGKETEKVIELTKAPVPAKTPTEANVSPKPTSASITTLPISQPPANQKNSGETLAVEAAALLGQMAKRYQSERQQLISITMAAEAKSSAQWKRLGNPEELEMLKTRKKILSKRKLQQERNSDLEQPNRLGNDKGKYQPYGEYPTPETTRQKQRQYQGQNDPNPIRRNNSNSSAPPVIPF